MNQLQFFNRFLSDPVSFRGKLGNVSVRQGAVFSYSTPVAFFDHFKQVFFISENTYSVTTAKQLSILRRAIGDKYPLFTVSHLPVFTLSGDINYFIAENFASYRLRQREIVSLMNKARTRFYGRDLLRVQREFYQFAKITKSVICNSDWATPENEDNEFRRKARIIYLRMATSFVSSQLDMWENDLIHLRDAISVHGLLNSRMVWGSLDYVAPARLKVSVLAGPNGLDIRFRTSTGYSHRIADIEKSVLVRNLQIALQKVSKRAKLVEIAENTVLHRNSGFYQLGCQFFDKVDIERKILDLLGELGAKIYPEPETETA